MSATLPSWAEAAIAAQAPAFDDWQTRAGVACVRYREIVDRLRARWLELEIDFVPAVARLPSDLGRQVILQQSLWAAKYWGNGEGRRLRDARDQVLALDTEIAAAAQRLAELMARRDTLMEAAGVSGADAPLAEVLRAAFARNPSWRPVYEPDEFLDAMSTSSRGPTVTDVVAAVAKAFNVSGPETPFDDIIQSRKSTADHRAALVHALQRVYGRRAEIGPNRMARGHPEIPADFTLPDRSVAALVAVLFDRDDSPEAVKVSRSRQR